MTISSETSKSGPYTCNGSTSVFAYTFKILSDDHILVQVRNTSTGVLTTLVKTTDYTVSGVGVATGGNVTLVDAATDAPSGYTLILTRDVPETQETDYNEYDTFPATSHEAALDKLTMIAQQHAEELNRSLKLDPVVSGFNAQFVGTPTASQVPIVNTDATGFTWADLSAIDSYSFGTGTGVLVQIAPGTAIVRTNAGTVNEITVTNGDGVSGNPTYSLPTALTFTGKTVTGGTFSAITISGSSALTGTITGSGSANISGSFAGSPTFTGTLTLGALVMTGGATFLNTGLKMYDSNASNVHTISLTSDITANRQFSIVTGDADRTLTLSGNVTLTSGSLAGTVSSGTHSGTNTGDETLSRVQALVTARTTQVFTSGSGTYTTPANVKTLKVTVIGGGGGGSGSGTGTTGGVGSDGVDSTFGSFTGAKGLGGTNPGSSGAGGAGGVGSGGTLNLTGQTGGGCQIAVAAAASGSVSGAPGGNSSLFNGAGGFSNSISGAAMAGLANTGGGGGGGLANVNAVRSGTGGGGGGTCIGYINSPSATYSYAVGGGGNGGSAGTSGFAGGNGGSGLIIVEEFYI